MNLCSTAGKDGDESSREGRKFDSWEAFAEWDSRIPHSHRRAPTLQYLYCERHWSLSAIGERYGVCKSTVCRQLKRHDIPTRGPGASSGRGEGDE